MRKYTRRDVCRLLRWDRDEGSTVNGYRVKHGTCPIFVTYHKDEELQYTIQYQDQFVNRHQFSWMTRSQRRLSSAEIQPILNQAASGLEIHLFVKKGDDEGAAHYYLGRMRTLTAVETVIGDKGDPSRQKPIVNVRFAMEEAVREDVFGYLVE